MRKAFAEALVEIAAEDPRVVLLTADLGFMVLEGFASAYPDRFYNVGVAEANMVGIATGLAEAGHIPFLYSIATFAALRPYEQFRNGPILHGLPVRLVGIGGGFEYGHSGVTHFALEDLGVMRLQPGLTTIAPADPRQTRTALLETYRLPGPIYYRIGKNDTLVVPGLEGRFRTGRVEVVREGKELLILSTGAISAEAAAAADLLSAGGVQPAMGVVATLRPEPTEDLAALTARFGAVLTVETHYVTGGLGSLVAEVVAERGIPCRLGRCGVRAMPSGPSGGEAYMNGMHDLSATKIAEKALALLAGLA